MGRVLRRSIAASILGGQELEGLDDGEQVGFEVIVAVWGHRGTPKHREVLERRDAEVETVVHCTVDALDLLHAGHYEHLAHPRPARGGPLLVSGDVALTPGHSGLGLGCYRHGAP